MVSSSDWDGARRLRRLAILSSHSFEFWFQPLNLSSPSAFQTAALGRVEFYIQRLGRPGRSFHDENGDQPGGDLDNLPPLKCPPAQSSEQGHEAGEEPCPGGPRYRQGLRPRLGLRDHPRLVASALFSCR